MKVRNQRGGGGGWAQKRRGVGAGKIGQEIKHKTNYLWSLKMAAAEVFFAVAVILYVLFRRRRCHRLENDHNRKRKWKMWVRSTYGHFHSLVKELRLGDRE